MEDFILTILPKLGWSGTVAFLGYLLYRTLPYLTRNGNGPHIDKKIKKFEKFKTHAETNHWNDIEKLKAGQTELWKAVDGIRKEQTQQGKDIAYIKGKLNGQ
jgi:hypothetical protein